MSHDINEYYIFINVRGKHHTNYFPIIPIDAIIGNNNELKIGSVSSNGLKAITKNGAMVDRKMFEEEELEAHIVISAGHSDRDEGEDHIDLDRISHKTTASSNITQSFFRRVYQTWFCNNTFIHSERRMRYRQGYFKHSHYVETRRGSIGFVFR